MYLYIYIISYHKSKKKKTIKLCSNEIISKNRMVILSMNSYHNTTSFEYKIV